MSKIKQSELEGIRGMVKLTGEFRVHLIYSRGGTVTARMWHWDGVRVGSAGGGGYDKRGAALGEAIERILGRDELKALREPKRTYNGHIVPGSGLYGVRVHGDGSRSLDGACGLECMLAVLEALGFKSIETHETGRDSTLVIAKRTPNYGSKS